MQSYEIFIQETQHTKIFGESRFRKSVWTRPAVNSLSDAIELIQKLKYFCAIKLSAAMVLQIGYRMLIQREVQNIIHQEQKYYIAKKENFYRSIIRYKSVLIAKKSSRQPQDRKNGLVSAQVYNCTSYNKFKISIHIIKHI